MKGYRTLAINAGIAGLGGTTAYLATIDWSSVDPRAAFIVPTVVIPLLNMIVRAFTSTPVGRKVV